MGRSAEVTRNLQAPRPEGRGNFKLRHYPALRLVDKVVAECRKLDPNLPAKLAIPLANRTLTPIELVKANALLEEVRSRLTALAGGDTDLLFAYRRKVFKELMYDERSKPAVRVRLKKLKRVKQAGLCAICVGPLPEKDSVLDRLHAVEGYTEENTRLICRDCDLRTQTERGFA